MNDMDFPRDAVPDWASGSGSDDEFELQHADTPDLVAVHESDDDDSGALLGDDLDLLHPSEFEVEPLDGDEYMALGSPEVSEVSVASRVGKAGHPLEVESGGVGGGDARWAERRAARPRPIVFSWARLWKFVGPGWLMSLAFVDPGNLESDLQSGASTGYALIWVTFWATVLGLMFQLLALRVGVVSGLGLSRLCRRRFSKPMVYLLWIMTEVAIIGSDIQEVVGSAIALNILFSTPLWVGVLITAADTFTFLLLHRAGVRKLEALFAALVAVMSICFAIAFGISEPDGGEILKGWAVPSVPSGSLFQAVGIVGAIIMPHNIYLHSSLVLSRDVNRKSRSRIAEAIYYFTIESCIALGVSFFINLCIIAVFAKGFYNNPNAPDDVGLRAAGTELRREFGRTAQLVWAIGLLASGQASTCTGVEAGKYVMSGFLNLRIPAWKRVALTRSIALVPAMLVAILARDELDSLDEYINVLQSVQLPFALLPVFMFACDRATTGPFALNRKWQLFYWSVLSLLFFSNAYLVYDFVHNHVEHTPFAYICVAFISCAYLSVVAMLVKQTCATSVASLRPRRD